MAVATCSPSYAPGRRRNKNRLRHQVFKFIKTQRAVVERGRQAKTVLNQILLARAVTEIHRADLRDGGMAFIDEQERVFWQVVHQRRRRLPRRAPGEISRIVFDAAAVTQLAHHFQIILRALLKALRFKQFVTRAQVLKAQLQFAADVAEDFADGLRRRHIVTLWIDR